MNVAAKYQAWSTIRRVLGGEVVTLADGVVLTRESVLDLLEMTAPGLAGPPIRALESGARQPAVRQDVAQRPGPTIQIGC